MPSQINAALARDWKAEVADGLDRLAAELPDAPAYEAQVVYDALTTCLLQLAIVALLETRPGAELRLPSDAELDSLGAELGWPRLLELAEQLGRQDQERPAGDTPALRAFGFGHSSLHHLLGWLRAMASQAELDGDGGVRELGALHEILLGFRLERLASPARRLRKNGAWLCPARVLDEAPELRGQWLQRELGLSKHQVESHAAALCCASSPAEVEGALASLFDPRLEARDAGRWVIQPSSHRRHSGAHYTPWEMCKELVELSLAPVVAALAEPRSRALLELRVCDPAMGAGAFLVAATRYLAEVLLQAWQAEATDRARALTEGEPVASRREARRVVAGCVPFGVDKNPLAVLLSRWTLRLFASPDGAPLEGLNRRLLPGDALTGGDVMLDAATPSAVSGARPGGVDFRRQFPDVFGRANPGFDAVIGNPPWIAYVGRAAQPLEPALSAYYASTNPAFKRYRTLHGLFVYRSATLLRAGGRLGLILPTSVADLDGYAATRSAHDRLCEVDAALPDWGDGAFTGVFQPSMALLSTRRSLSDAPPSSGVWPLAGDALGPTQRALLERLRSLPRLPRELFGERGFQTTPDARAHLLRSSRGAPPFSTPLREGADIGEFRALPPQLFADADGLGARLRAPAEWEKVSLLIRQTARFPIAARADGLGFRNSILAAFASPEWPAASLLCFLNSSLARWFHYTLHRDARQGMPQLKIGHLRALPALPGTLPRARDALERLGRDLSRLNAGIAAGERARLDELVAEIFSLDGLERAVVTEWASSHPPPISRRAAQHRPADLPADAF